MPDYLTAAEAASRLNVSRQTLYAYVSRGLLRAQPGASHRESRYLADEVERLAGERTRGRKPKEVARATLDWGLPVLESSITLIHGGQLFYRGESAITLAASHSVEDVAAHLWQCRPELAFGPRQPSMPAVMPALLHAYHGHRAEQALLPLFAVASDDDGTAAWQPSPDRLLEGCGALVRQLAACLLGTTPDTAPIHLQCARAWGVDVAGADLIRMALVLCADHELNASGFTARCVASTGASLRAAVAAGLAALTGGKHGGTTARVESMWDAMRDGSDQRESESESHGSTDSIAADAPRRMRERLARGEDLAGFGHHLYPHGDVRATALLGRILPDHPAWQPMLDEAFALLGLRPSIDFALVAMRRHLGLPAGAAFGLFALGRSIGWIAHGLEQRGNDNLIRPRAAYVGVWPGATPAHAGAPRVK